jgi:DNA recombination protein RmuC
MALDASLSQYFSRDSYSLQHYFKSGEAVDAVLKLPNELLLPIDSKFSWENFEKMINSEKESERQVFQKTFFNDVKKKIDEIASKYILPSEGTLDMALMYVPAETVYYELISNTHIIDILGYARKKKVLLTSPNMFVGHVSAIRQWIKDIQLSKQTKEIMKKLDRVIIDSVKLEEDFGKLGKHMKDAQGAFDSSEKRLTFMTDRVQKILEIEDEEEPKKLDANHLDA